MKSKFIFLLLTLVLLPIISSCGSNAEKFSAYECPMNCENKTYPKPGSCPVCGMDLEGITEKNK